MPTAPRGRTGAGIQGVTPTQTPLRGSNIPTPQADIDSPFAAGMRTVDAAEGALNTAIQIEDKERRKANQLLLQEKDLSLSKTVNSLLYDRETGAMNRLGKDALGAADELNPKFSAAVEKLREGMTVEQAGAFNAAVTSRKKSLDRVLKQHMARQGMIYDEEVTKSSIAQEVENAVRNAPDEEGLLESIDRIGALRTAQGDRHGRSKKWIKNATMADKSGVHSSYIARLVDGEQDMLAVSHFKKYEKQLTAEDHAKMTRLLKQSTLRGTARRMADQFWTAAKGNYGRAMSMAEKVENAELRQRIERNIDQELGQFMRARNFNEDSNWRAANEHIKRGRVKMPGKSADDYVPLSIWNRLTREQQDALNKATTLNAPNDEDRFLVFLDVVKNHPTRLQQMSREKYDQYFRSHFDKRHRAIADRFWLNSQKGGGKFTSTRTFTQTFDAMARDSGLFGDEPPTNVKRWDEDKRRRYNEMFLEAEEAATALEKEKGRKLNPKETREVIEDVMRVVEVDRGWFGSNTFDRPANLTPEEAETARVPLDRIPEGWRTKLANIYRSNKNEEPSDNLISQAYGALLVGDYRRFRELLGIRESSGQIYGPNPLRGFERGDATR